MSATVGSTGLLWLALLGLGPQEEDLRTAYDVQAYELQLAVRPDVQVLEGVVDVEATVVKGPLSVCRLDLNELHRVLAVSDGQGRPLEFEREGHGLKARLARPFAKDETFRVRIHYRGKPEGKGFDGFHWERSAEGKPWINTACQGLGAHYWYPCKASFFHPDDKPARVAMAITAPADLVGVSNGRLREVVEGAPAWFEVGEAKKWKTWRWQHDYPLETYAVTLNVGPYEHVASELQLPGIEKPVPYHYYVLPENAAKAALQFQQVPDLLRIFSEAFGPWPFPEAKFALVETNFWGMEHSTAIAYGSSYPAWCKANGAKDAYANRNRWFDYILVHEVAHEWWGNAVSADHWGHFWIHEGFGTYAEGVYVEGMQGREAADRYFAEMARGVPGTRGKLYRGDRPDSGAAYSGLIYYKGATVLHTLRHYLDDDEVWWRTLADFNREFRYGNASTEDFQAVLERNSGEDWERFFQEWVYGVGTPALTVRLKDAIGGALVEIKNEQGRFRVPLDLWWQDGDQSLEKRLWIEPGTTRKGIPVPGGPRKLHVRFLSRLLGKHEVFLDA